MPGVSGDPGAIIAPPPVPPEPQKLLRPGGQVSAPQRITANAPEYPGAARAARIEGTVILDAVIDVNGSVRDVRVLRSIALLDQAAVAAVRQWRYTPALLNGIPVPVIMTVTVTFKLQ
jgi:protein TonB